MHKLIAHSTAYITTFIQDEKRAYFFLIMCFLGLVALNFAWPKMAGMMWEYMLYLSEQMPDSFPDDPAVRSHKNPFAP